MIVSKAQESIKVHRGISLMSIIKISIIVIGIAGAVGFFVARNTYLPNEYSVSIEKYSAEYNLNPNLVRAVIKTESSYNPMSVSNMGAYGLMQITDQTGYYIASNIGMGNFNQTMLYNPDVNIQMGCWYLRNLINEFDNVNTALAAYNAGRGNVVKWLNNPEYSPNKEELTKIPFKETANYVKRVNFYEKLYTICYK